jgi:hypothetical protein
VNTQVLDQAIATVHERADVVEEVAGENVALGLRWAAAEFEAALNEWCNEALTVGEATQECPWEASTIATKLRKGELPQAGKPGAPRVRRRDLFAGSAEPAIDGVVAEALGQVR